VSGGGERKAKGERQRTRRQAAADTDDQRCTTIIDTAKSNTCGRDIRRREAEISGHRHHASSSGRRLDLSTSSQGEIIITAVINDQREQQRRSNRNEPTSGN
jgi:hypothetical protein